MTAEELQLFLKECISKGELIHAVLSAPERKETASKVVFRPVMLRQGIFFQASEHHKDKVIHRNLSPEQLVEALRGMLTSDFKQAIFFTRSADWHLLRNRKGHLSMSKHKASKAEPLLIHNRTKTYLLPEGTPVDFLVHLGVMSRDGKVIAKKRDKFKQINRFLEIVDDVLVHFAQDKALKIIDFGCGKSYLSFALYYYLKHVKGYHVSLTGLDLKKDVIDFCAHVAKELQYKDLHFQVGDINHYSPEGTIDMVVCLHACDTATDAAIENAVRWQARVILAVPCCQHELYKQVENDALAPLLRHGILRERFAALVTDAARAQLLEVLGYKCQIMEFIDLEHTPKNLLIRAIKSEHPGDTKAAWEQYLTFAQQLNIHPFLQKKISSLNPIEP